MDDQRFGIEQDAAEEVQLKAVGHCRKDDRRCKIEQVAAEDVQDEAATRKVAMLIFVFGLHPLHECRRGECGAMILASHVRPAGIDGRLVFAKASQVPQ